VVPEDGYPEAATDRGNTLLEPRPGKDGSLANPAALEALRRANGAAMGLIRKGQPDRGLLRHVGGAAPPGLAPHGTRRQASPSRSGFDDPALQKAVIERFMAPGKGHFQ
jgi:hypothetical protein